MRPEVVTFAAFPGRFRVDCYQCEHVDCSCTEVTFVLKEQRARDERPERPPKIVLRVDVPTWQETSAPEGPPGTEAVVAEFLRDYPTAEREELMAWYRERERIIQELESCRIDAREVENGTLVSFREILAPAGETGWQCPMGEYSVDCDGSEYTVVERFCPNPACRCRTVRLSFMKLCPDPDVDGRYVAEEEFSAGLSLDGELDPDKLCGTDEPSAERVLARWKELHAVERDRLTWRYEKIKEIGARSLALRRDLRRDAGGGAKPPVGRIGRNSPCPCGSGKKYKKCCGRTSQAISF